MTIGSSLWLHTITVIQCITTAARRAREARLRVDSADVFSELHHKTGRNVIADYHLRVYPRRSFVNDGKLLDVLNGAADALQSRWERDGAFIRFRRANYYAERAMDVPNRQLARWRASRERAGTLTLDDLAEVSTLPGPLLNDTEFDRAVVLKWSLDDWALVRNAPWWLSIYRALTPGERAAIQSDAGFAPADAPPDQAAALQKAMGATDPAHWARVARNRHWMRITRSARYRWAPEVADAPIFPGQAPVREADPKKAAEAAKAYAQAHGIPTPANELPIELQTRRPGEGFWQAESQDGRVHHFEIDADGA